MTSLKRYIKGCLHHVFWSTYRKFYIPIRAAKIRRKDKITVLFEVFCLGAWKTETLYQAMLKHPRFEPILVFTTTFEDDEIDSLKNYAQKRGYHYHIWEKHGGAYWKRFRPDIIFYQKPYYPEFPQNKRSLFCFVPYCFHATKEDWGYKTPFLQNVWQMFFESQSLAKEYAQIVGTDHRCCVGTGLPCMDELIRSKESFIDPWRDRTTKKRIIYAPHHSIDSSNVLQISSFLQTGELMLEIAEKYSDRVAWAFKPHPLLRIRLNKIWGTERTDAYFKRWEQAEWSSFESGEYVGLFKYSDAMIHDCSSFMVEYLYTCKPVMFLVRDEDTFSNLQRILNNFNKEALDLHKLGRTSEEIEGFIKEVIDGTTDANDIMRKQQFIESELTPPNSLTSPQNIINCILGRSSLRPY